MVIRRHAPYNKLKFYLKEHDILQEKFAKDLGISPSAFNQKLNGTGGDFSMKEVRAICKKLNISADDFFISLEVSFTKQKEEVS